MSSADARWLVIHESLGHLGYCARAERREGRVRFLQMSKEVLTSIHSSVPTAWELCQVLDRFCLVLPRHDGRVRQATLDDFFRWLGRDYDTIVDISRNLENIAVLVGLLGLSPPAVIGDFGCGTGLALLSPSTKDFTLVGIDSCRAMRELTRIRGMLAMSPDDLDTDLRLDGIMASYVLHFGPDELSLVRCWDRLRGGGMFVANLHKGQGLDRAISLFDRIGGRLLSADARLGLERHGIYVQIEKP